MRVILARHGETDYNIESRIMGWKEIPLNQNGRNQIIKLAEFLNKNYSISKIYSSDLLRTKQSAEIINNGLRINEIIYKSNLREHSFGDWEGLLFNYLKSKKSYIDYLELRNEEKSAPNGETINYFNDRVLSEFKIIVRENIDSNVDILIVAHGGTNRVILGNLFRISFSESQRIIIQSNACINEIIFNRSFDDYKVGNLNVTSFLLR